MLTYNVYNDIARLRTLVDDFFSDAEYRQMNREYPPVNITDSGEEIVIEAVVPGLASEDIALNLENNTLLIEGEKKDDYTQDKYLRRERRFGSFKRSVKLPYRVDPEKIDAGLNNGILTVKLVKSEEAKPRKISIQ